MRLKVRGRRGGGDRLEGRAVAEAEIILILSEVIVQRKLSWKNHNRDAFCK